MDLHEANKKLQAAAGGQAKAEDFNAVKRQLDEQRKQLDDQNRQLEEQRKNIDSKLKQTNEREKSLQELDRQLQKRKDQLDNLESSLKKVCQSYMYINFGLAASCYPKPPILSDHLFNGLSLFLLSSYGFHSVTALLHPIFFLILCSMELGRNATPFQ